MIRKAERQDVPLLLEDGTVTLYSKDVGLEPRRVQPVVLTGAVAE
jgi:hypothetical protein